MNINDFDDISLVGIRVNPDTESSDFLTLLFESDVDTVLNQKESVIFFSDIKDAKKILLSLDANLAEKAVIPQKITMVIDLANALYLLENEENDELSDILNCLNFIFDVIKSTDISFPQERKNLLFGLADFLTFDKNFARYLKEKNVERTKIIDEILWCCGKILSKSILFKDRNIS